ncbi:hypothetical protein AQUCO_00600042v1 [Aquilegia coerulea]|uniref:Uncharacterized protein n=1 Tax=Aquilegia coerulea TaxID=218851 RepID=A0A2G5EMU7_AQUCA|nr:hypothetical protein AQUCO_00600042v1 [Aquilegia coerulea]
MDSSLTKQKPVKLLSELLQEQQEPFCLDVYLLERGYPKKILSKGRNGGSSIGNSSKDLSTLSSHGLKRRKKISPCPKILKTVLNKLISNNILVSCKDELKTASFDARSIQNGKTNVSIKGKMNYHASELDRFSSASSMTICDSSCSESDMEDEFSPPQQNQISSSCTSASQTFKPCQLTDHENAIQQCGCLEESKQHSPVSVLDEIPSHEVSPFHSHNAAQDQIRRRTRQLQVLINRRELQKSRYYQLLYGIY